MKKALAKICAAGLAVALLTACGGAGSSSVSQQAASPAGQGGSAPAAAAVTISVGFENPMTDPMSQAVQHWKELLEEQSGGAMVLELYPDSQLGSKTDLINSMQLGEPVITIADGAFLAEYGAPDLGIVFGPYLFTSWEQCWKLTESDWYAQQDALLNQNGLKIVASNWKLGQRHTLTKSPVQHPEDLKGMKIRVPNNQVQIESFNAIGATSTPMAASEVYQALQTGTVDGLENVTSAFYSMKWAEPAKYVYKDAHIYNFAIWVCSNDFFNSLAPDQQALLLSTAKEAGLYNNDSQDAAEADYVKLLQDEMGVTFTEVSPEDHEKLVQMSQSFYDNSAAYGWSDGLYDTVKAAMGE